MKKLVIILLTLTLTLPIVLISTNKTVKAYQPPPSSRIGFTRAISTVPGEEFIIFGKNDNSTPDIYTGLTIKMFQWYFGTELTGVDYMDWLVTWDWNGFRLYLDNELYSNINVALVRYDYTNQSNQTTIFLDINYNVITTLSMEDVSSYNSIELKRYITTGGYSSEDLQDAYDNGKDEGIIEAVDLHKDTWFKAGEAVGYGKGLEENLETGGFIMILSSAFVGVSTLLGIHLLPGISLGMIVAVPLVFGILFFILGKKKD